MSSMALPPTCCICTDAFAEGERTIACQACLARVLDPNDFSGNMHVRCFSAWVRQTCPICDQVISLPSPRYGLIDNSAQPAALFGNYSRLAYPYEFGLFPADHQPSAGITSAGSCTFSRYDNMRLMLDMPTNQPDYRSHASPYVASVVAGPVPAPFVHQSRIEEARIHNPTNQPDYVSTEPAPSTSEAEDISIPLSRYLMG
jgi:hypothetical protein